MCPWLLPGCQRSLLGSLHPLSVPQPLRPLPAWLWGLCGEWGPSRGGAGTPGLDEGDPGAFGTGGLGKGAALGGAPPALVPGSLAGWGGAVRTRWWEAGPPLAPAGADLPLPPQGCQHNTEGDHCERCRAGSVRSGSEDPGAPCVSCPCPLAVPSNKYAGPAPQSPEQGPCLMVLV